MKTIDYSHKPKEIKTVDDLIAFFEPIPARAGCVDTRYDEKGRHCAFGHLDSAYNQYTGGAHLRFLPSPTALAVANNGTVKEWCEPRKEGVSTSGKAIKSRVLRFLRGVKEAK